jgi:oligoendopeptidase F
LQWAVYSNEIQGDGGAGIPEPNTRYEVLLNAFQAQRAADGYYPTYENYIDRSFNKYREIPEETVKELFTTLLSSEEFKQVGQLVQSRLGRNLEPFDIWYNGFRGGQSVPENKLDQIVQEKYPNVDAFKDGIPAILTGLGFDTQTAEFLESKIEVDPSRGAGHAMGAGRRSDNAHLRTRIPDSGMNYKGYNIAIHELGHNVEQVFSLNRIDYTLLEGVPNTAFTEAFAFVFQARDLELLGLGSDSAEQDRLMALNQLWSVCEIAGVSLVDMGVWNWMYENPAATPAELKNATIAIAQEIWNEYFAPVFGVKDSPILAIYSHMIDYPLYLPNYPIGHIIQFQIEDYIEDKNLAEEMERMCTIGSVTPEHWMQQAVGEPISVQPILDAAGKAVKEIS